MSTTLAKKAPSIKKSASSAVSSSGKDVKKLQNKYGYFTGDGKEYVITRPDTPRPWVNVLSNGDYGTVVSQTGGSFSWRENSNLSRITRWEQDLIKDEWGSYVYLRDNDTKKFWSLTWKPTCPNFDFFEVRYGTGYAVHTSELNGIRAEKTTFVALKDPVEIWKIRLTNKTNKKRSIGLYSYFEWCLGNSGDTHREFHKTFIETNPNKALNALYGYKRPALVPHFISTGLAEKPLEAFHASSEKLAGFDGDKEAFFGNYGNLLAPRAVVEGKSKNTWGKWCDSVASLSTNVELGPNEEKTVIFLLGATRERKESEVLIKKYTNVANAEKELQAVKDFWNEFTGRTWVETPDDGFNFMTNTWLKYQAIAGRIWAKCAYYQSSGGIGFRDQLQDCQVFFPIEPSLAKKQILIHAEQQFPDGTVYHWWHPNTNMGAITEMTDDLVWLAYITLNYLDETQDFKILDEVVNFLKDPKDKNAKVTKGDLYDHCCRAIDKVLSRWSPRGLPLIGEGDWNDGFSHVGPKMKGESIWLGHFMVGILRRFAEICDMRGEKTRAKNYRDRAEKLVADINKHAWEDDRYIRATRDDGKVMGSKTCDQGKIDLMAQAWALIHNVAPADRAKKCMETAYKHLYKEYGPLLLTPAYHIPDPNIGYITRYAPGLRENGGVYTHAACWGLQAVLIQKKGDFGFETYKSFSPPHRGANPDLYYVEPYATPGNVDGPDSPNFGRGGWTWYTGSGAWLFRISTDWLLGIRPVKEGLLIDPVVPKKWGQFKMRRLFRGATYNITVTNPNKVESGVKSIVVDGKAIKGAIVPAFKDTKTHTVEVVMG